MRFQDINIAETSLVNLDFYFFILNIHKGNKFILQSRIDTQSFISLVKRRTLAQ